MRPFMRSSARDIGSSPRIMDPRQKNTAPLYAQLLDAPLDAATKPSMAAHYSQIYTQTAAPPLSRPLVVPPPNQAPQPVKVPRYVPPRKAKSLSPRRSNTPPGQMKPSARQVKAAAWAKSEALKKAPKPDAEYIQQAHNRPFARPEPKKMLVILDLNGTLVFRTNNRQSVIKRPFLDQFLKSLFKNHKVLVWSSARPDAVRGMVNKIMTPQQRKDVVGIWARDTLRLTDSEYREKTQVYKQLTWVWADKTVQDRSDSMWDQTNTVLIDDSFLKASSEPFNHIEVPEFDKDMVDQEETQSQVLRELLTYLEEASYFEDVSTFIRYHPFKLPGTIQGAGAPSAALAAMPSASFTPINKPSAS